MKLSFVLGIGSGKSHFLYTFALYLWSRKDYGRNGNPLILFIPHSECNFEQVVDCVKMAFHHTDLPEWIDLGIEFKRKSFTEDQLHTFLNKGTFLSDGTYELRKHLFDILKVYGQKSVFGSQSKGDLISDLIDWSKRYAKQILNQFRFFLSHFSNFFSNFFNI